MRGWILRKFRGFSLIEVLVSIAVMVAIVSIVTRSIIMTVRINTENADGILAMGLAKEGIEMYRNIRDSLWVNGCGWGKGERLGVDSINFNNNNSSIFLKIERVQGTSSKCYVGFKVSSININAIPNKVSDLASSSDLNLKVSNSGKFGVDSGENSKFYRVLRVEVLDDSKKIVRVSSVVFWESYGRVRNVVVTTELTDWWVN